MNIEEITRPLSIDEIDFRVKQVTKNGYALLLAYKNSRVDKNRLDKAFGIFGWQNRYEIINGNLFCSIGIYNESTKEWIWKQDVGVESNTEKEKGEASDAFKRACFNIGIGRELYNYPLIMVKLLPNEYDAHTQKTTFNFKPNEWLWHSEFDEHGKLVFLGAKDNGGSLRYKYDIRKGKNETTRL